MFSEELSRKMQKYFQMKKKFHISVTRLKPTGLRASSPVFFSWVNLWMQECFYAEILFKLSFLTKVMGNKELSDYTEVADADTFY